VTETTTTSDQTAQRSSLRSGAVGFFGTLAGSIGLQGPTGGVAFLPAAMAASVALSGPLAFGLGTIAMVFVAYAFVVFSRRLASSGSVYAFNGTALGPKFGFVSVVILFGAYVSTAGWVVIIAADFVQGALSTAGWQVSWVPIAVLLIIVIFAMSYRALHVSSHAILVVELVSVVLLLVVAGFVIAKGGAGGHGLHASYFTPRGQSWSVIGLGVVFAFTSVSGFEGAAYLGEETKKATRNIPLAIWTSLLAAGVIYTFFSWVESAAYGSASALSSTSLPMVDIANAFVGQKMGILVDIAAAVSSFGCALSALNGSGRLLFSVSRDGIGPAVLSRTHRRHNTPVAALALTALIALVMVLAESGAEPLTAVYDLATYTADTFILVYLLTVFAALVWSLRIRRNRREPIILAIGVLVMAYVLKDTMYPFPAAPYSYALEAALATVLLAAVLLAVPGLRRKLASAELFKVTAEN
jgi:amino acid transporter